MSSTRKIVQSSKAKKVLEETASQNSEQTHSNLIVLKHFYIRPRRRLKVQSRRRKFEEFDQIFKEEIIEEEPVERKPLSEFNLKYERDDFDEEEKHPVNQVIKVKAENYISEDLLPDIVKYETEAVKTELEIDISYEDVKTDIGGDLNENEFDSKECTIIKSDESPAGNRSPELETGTEILLHKTEDSAERTVKIEKATENSRSTESRSQCKQLDLTFKEEDIEEVSIDRKLIYESNESDEDEKHLVNQIVKVEDENYPTLFGDLLPNIDYETNRVKTEYEIDDSYEDVKTETCGEELNENKFDLEEYTFSKVERSHDEEIEPNASLEFIAGYVDNIHSHTSTSQDNFLPKDHEENPREGQFSQKPNIKDHEEGHTKYEVKRPFQCDLCPKSFILKKMLILHRYTHTREIFLKCKYCSEYYTRSAILTHMEIHDCFEMATKNNVLESVREDDFIEYFLFPPINIEDEKEQEVLISTVLEKANKIVQKFSRDYLWHKDEFKLIPRTSISNSLGFIEGDKETLPPHLYGVSHYGDNIEDEWFMVFILQQLTKDIDGSIARVHDVDGEFLLIEAADYLPTWANPDTCENRVYLYNGNVHLIPVVSPEDAELTMTDALSIIRADPSKTLACPNIQNSIKNKVNNYPEKITDNLHHATIYVPVAIAGLLNAKPNLIAPAIHSFCNRDAVDLKSCRAMKYFPPENRVKRRVAFTKCLYAMLKHSKYTPDRRTGWNLPPQNSPDFRAHSLGVKVACGFEILAAQAKPSAEIDSDRGWHNYLKSLKDKGYFKDLLEHSVGYNNLLNKAKEYYINHRDTMHYSPAIGQEILDMTRNLDCDAEQLRKEEGNLPKDDDDSWLEISPEELDKMLQEKYGQKKIFNVNNNTDPTSLTEKISTFLNHVSDLDGAEFPDQNDSPVRPPRRKNKSKVSFSQDAKTSQQTTNNKINFDPNSFACAVQNILNFSIPDDDSWDLDSDSDMSEYEEDNCVKNPSYEDVKTKMQQYMDEMDKELAGTTIGESFEKKNGDSFDDIESFKPVDIDVNALKNMLESYKSQMGEAGPSSNLLGPMGVNLDAKEDMDMA
ncbi:hypothetical protein JTB14_019668 [Gonioctena quinquepunctata]|nr:hypothetical protein JTB14_019668 [Gonioctena quinquepunctata]